MNNENQGYGVTPNMTPNTNAQVGYGVQPTQPINPQQPMQGGMVTPPTSNGNGKNTAIIAIIIVLIAVIGVLAYLLLTKDEKKNNDSGNETTTKEVTTKNDPYLDDDDTTKKTTKSIFDDDDDYTTTTTRSSYDDITTRQSTDSADKLTCSLKISSFSYADYKYTYYFDSSNKMSKAVIDMTMNLDGMGYTKKQAEREAQTLKSTYEGQKYQVSYEVTDTELKFTMTIAASDISSSDAQLGSLKNATKDIIKKGMESQGGSCY